MESSCIQIVSDLHMEMEEYLRITPYAPYLALLGDIGAPFQPHYAAFLEAQSTQFQHVFVIFTIIK